MLPAKQSNQSQKQSSVSYSTCKMKISLISTLHQHLRCRSILVLMAVSLSNGIVFAVPKPPENLTVDGSNVTDQSSPNECSNMKPNWVFCSSFEEGNKNIWDDYDGNPDSTNLIMKEPGPAGITGNNVMRLRVPPGRGIADLVKVLPQSYDKLYARWYVQWEPGYDFNTPNHGGGLHAGGRGYLGRSDFRPTGNDWFTGWIEPETSLHKLYVYSYYRGMNMDCVDPNGQCWGDSFINNTSQNPVLNTGRWYCVEMMMEAGTPTNNLSNANGTINFWLDGKEMGPWTNLWLRTTPDLKINILWLSLFHHGQHPVEGIMLDNVVASTTRIGCF